MGAAAVTEMRKWTGPQSHSVGKRLNKNLGPEFVSYRPAPGGGRVAYLEGWKAINLANDTFGFNGWSTEIRTLTVDYCDELPGGRYSVGVSSTVRVTLKDGTYHEDVGFGHIENAKMKYMAFDKCRKEATTDGIKRTLRQFGNALGNCLYNQSYTKQVSRLRCDPSQIEKDDLVRDMDFQDQFHGKFSYGKEITHQASSLKVAVKAEVKEPPKAIEPPSYIHRPSNNMVPSELQPPEPQSSKRQPPEPQTLPPQQSVPASRRASTSIILDPDSIYQNLEDAPDEFYDELDFDDDLMSDDLMESKPSLPVKSEQVPQAQPPPPQLPQAQQAPQAPQAQVVQLAGSSFSHSTPPTTDSSSQSNNDSSNGVPNTPIKFFKASAATAIQQNSPVSAEFQFDPSFQSPTLRRTLSHNKSVPIKRSEIISTGGMNKAASGQDATKLTPPLAGAGPRQAPTPNSAKPSPEYSAPVQRQQSPVRQFQPPRRALGHPLARPQMPRRVGSPAAASDMQKSNGNTSNANNTGFTSRTSSEWNAPKRQGIELGTTGPNIPVVAGSPGVKAGSASDLPIDKKQRV